MVTMKHAGREDTLMLLRVTFLHQQIQLRLEAGTEEYPNTLSLGCFWYKEKTEKHIFQFTTEAHQKDPLKAFWVHGTADLPSRCLSAPNDGSCSLTSSQGTWHVPAPPPQAIRPTSWAHMQSHGSIHTPRSSHIFPQMGFKAANSPGLA